VSDDGSRDGSQRILRSYADQGKLTLLHGPRRGAAAAINSGILEARHPIICQIDQDVIIQPGWLGTLLGALDDPDVAAAQGHYVTAADAGVWARAMGRDLEQRYARIQGMYVNHVCTGNTAYRASALHDVGLLDENLGYGYDNDLSYRLSAHGHQLAFCRDAISIHRWREGIGGYLRQQFGVGYGRLDVVAKHPDRTRGDDVSGALMMLHAPAMLAALTALTASAIAVLSGQSGRPTAMGAVTILAALFIERTVAGVVSWRRSGDPASLSFGVTHLARDSAWAAAILFWVARRVRATAGQPSYSMQRGIAVDAGLQDQRLAVQTIQAGSLLVVVPALNEAANLPRVVAEVRRAIPEADLLIVNDGSTDDTADILPHLGVKWLTMPERVGVGGAVRAGITYGARHGYEVVVRVDGDGQHRACDIRRLLMPVVCGRADAVCGSRFIHRPRGRRGLRRVSQAALAWCLSLLTGRTVTDPTSGFWLFGPRAIRLLARHHPTGYAEPELVLLLNRNGLRVAEIPIRMRPRCAGRTSLTAARSASALARTLLAIVVVPLRRTVEEQGHD
jgi:glycosyltransferase involved in cell wall biosynthesis